MWNYMYTYTWTANEWIYLDLFCMPKSICVYMQIVYICDYMCGYLYIIHMIQRRSRDSDGSPFSAPHRSVSPSSTCASGPVRLTRPRGRKCVAACGYDAKLEMFTQSPVRMATRMGIVGLFSTRSDKRTYRKWDINCIDYKNTWCCVANLAPCGASVQMCPMLRRNIPRLLWVFRIFWFKHPAFVNFHRNTTWIHKSWSDDVFLSSCDLNHLLQFLLDNALVNSHGTWPDQLQLTCSLCFFWVCVAPRLEKKHSSKNALGSHTSRKFGGF